MSVESKVKIKKLIWLITLILEILHEASIPLVALGEPLRLPHALPRLIAGLDQLPGRGPGGVGREEESLLHPEHYEAPRRSQVINSFYQTRKDIEKSLQPIYVTRTNENTSHTT